MLVIGGAEPDNQPVGAVPDPWTHGLGVFDMTELSWSSSYDAKAQPYEQPSIVKEYYTRNPPQPHEWNDPALAAVFAFNISTKTSPVGNTSPVASSNGAATTTSERSATHRNNVGAIAGGVLGGLVAICIVLGIVLYFLRRQHQKRDVSQPPTSELEKHTPAQELPTGISHRSIHQLGPGDPWELDSTTRNTAPHSPHSDVLRW